MVKYSTTILKFDKNGEKTGWSYIEIPADVAKQLKPGFKKSFRVKGLLDNFLIEKKALLPMGEGAFIMPINSSMQKGIGKRHGALLTVQLEEDKSALLLNESLMECLADEPIALKQFSNLPPSHQQYYSKWIETAKTEATLAKRISMTVNAMILKQDFGEMLRAARSDS